MLNTTKKTHIIQTAKVSYETTGVHTFYITIAASFFNTELLEEELNKTDDFWHSGSFSAYMLNGIHIVRYNAESSYEASDDFAEEVQQHIYNCFTKMEEQGSYISFN
jgi:hypothetical protein